MKLSKTILTILLLLFGYAGVFSQDTKELVNEGRKLYNQEKYSLALEKYEQAIKVDNSLNEVYYRAACCASLLNRKKIAFNYLEKSIGSGFINVKHLKKNAAFKNINGKRRWRKVIKKLSKKIDSITAQDFGFEDPIIPFSKDLISEDSVKTILQSGFNLAGTGNYEKSSDENYCNLYLEFFEELKETKKIGNLIEDIKVNCTFDSAVEIDNFIKQSEKPVIAIGYSVLKGFSLKEFTFTESFYFGVIYQNKLIYLKEAKGTGNLKIIYSQKASKRLKKIIKDQLLKLLN